ncbi:hypothetical protein VH569_13120 [Azospirillum sp. 11R-A]|uniref:hypothetical protein n=1 Tax=Azospirillum sp. 11R-A TaxID=3111634 RepID=UPI003C250200
MALAPAVRITVPDSTPPLTATPVTPADLVPAARETPEAVTAATRYETTPAVALAVATDCTAPLIS